MKNIIEFKNTSFAYDNLNAFTDFNMSIDEKDIVTLIGPSGSGKTTLLKMLCNKLPNDTIYFEDKNIKTYEIQELQKNIIVIFDEPFTEKDFLNEVTKYLKKLNFDSSEIDERLEEMNKKFNFKRFYGLNLDDLSYSDIYLLKILRYIIIKPKFVAIDNLISNVNEPYKKKIFEYIKGNHITLLNVTNNLDEALYGNKIYVLENFVNIFGGSTLSVLKMDSLLKRLGFNLPLAVDLSIELNNYEVIDKIFTDNKKLVNELWK